MDHLLNFLDSEFESELSNEYNVGFFEGRSQWLVSDEDLQAMYAKFSTGSRITLWCENVDCNIEQPPPSKKRKEPSSTRKVKDKEEELEETYWELKRKHGDKWPDPHLRLWARYKINGYHNDLDNPPNAPPFNGVGPKRSKQESLSDALATAATAFAKAFSGPSSDRGMSPLKAADEAPGAVKISATADGGWSH